MAKIDDNKPLSATEFTPLDAPYGGRRKFPVSAGHLALGLVSIIAALILIYLFLARAVIFRPEPATAEINVSGISFHIGNNFLLLRGDHELNAVAEGYVPLEQTISVTESSTQEIEVALEPLPGNLNVLSQLDDIQVSIDDQPAGSAPGIIEGISRGSHKIEFSKHRYFPRQQEIDIEGLGRTQSLTVSLDPAWGQMQFSSVPAGADLYIDDQLIGQTPLTTEVLETGSGLSVSAAGYKTWRREVSVKAGTTEAYPSIELTIADGTLEIRSSPAGAGITIDEQFKGNTPLTVALSPLSDHRVELFLEGYEKAVRRVDIEPERRSSLAVDLKPIIGRIQLTIEPDDAEVLVDGGGHGRGSQTLALTAKEHEVTIRKEGYEAQSLKVTPRPGHEQALSINLLTVQQAYWASRPPRINSPVGSTLKLFRPDSVFTLGAPRREPGRRANEAQREVRLERPFYLGTHEVSNAEFRLWQELHSSTAIRGQTLDMEDQPVVNVTWQEAALFCNWLSSREGLPLFYIVENGLVTGFDVDSHGYRLPTEAEWAWAAKINVRGETDIFAWGSDLYPPVETIENYADQNATKFLTFTLSNYNDGYPVSAPVGSFQANSKGLYDMSGNVAEWINDYYDIRPARGEPELDPTGPETGNRHVIRGASWAMGSRSELRLSYREAGADGRLDGGFRLARYVDKAGVRQ
jgi:formylglycine-generating enzyme required for sulfatase activity